VRRLTQQRHLGFSLDLFDTSLRLPHYWSKHADIINCRCLFDSILCHKLKIDFIRLLGLSLRLLRGFILTSDNSITCFIKVIFDGLFLTELIGVKCHRNCDVLRTKKVSKDKRILSWYRAIEDNYMLRRLFLIVYNFSGWIHYNYWNELGRVSTLYVVGTLNLCRHIMADCFE